MTTSRFDTYYLAALQAFLTEPSAEGARKVHEAAAEVARLGLAASATAHGSTEHRIATLESELRLDIECVSQVYAKLWPQTSDVAAFVADIGIRHACAEMLDRIEELTTAMNEARDIAAERTAEVQALEKERAALRAERDSLKGECLVLRASLLDSDHDVACAIVNDDRIELPAKDEV